VVNKKKKHQSNMKEGIMSRMSQKAGRMILLYLIVAGSSALLAEKRATIPYTSTPAIIDGQMDDLYLRCEEQTTNVAKVNLSNWDGPEDCSIVFRVAYDTVNLYLFFDITDDELDTSGENTWTRDGMEIAIDGNNDKGTVYDCIDDYNLGILWDWERTEETLRWHGGDWGSVCKNEFPLDTTLIVWRQVEKPDGKGYTLELAVACETFGMKLTEGDEIGFDMQYNESEDGNRTAMLRWNNLENDDTNKNPSLHGTLVAGAQTSAIRSVQGAIDGFVLKQNYPNPFNPITRISYVLPGASIVKLSVYNQLGEEVAVLIDGKKSAGPHQIDFEASKLESGVYIARIESDFGIETRRMLLIK
jgi:hypothetical protein